MGDFPFLRSTNSSSLCNVSKDDFRSSRATYPVRNCLKMISTFGPQNSRQTKRAETVCLHSILSQSSVPCSTEPPNKSWTLYNLVTGRDPD